MAEARQKTGSGGHVLLEDLKNTFSRVLVLSIALLLFLPAAAHADETPEQLIPAKMQFDYGFFGDAIRMLDELIGQKLLSTEAELTEAWRIRGLSNLYQGNSDEAQADFFQLLMLSPDYKLDSLTVSPDALSMLEELRRTHQTTLDAIREKIRALKEQEALNAAAQKQENCAPDRLLVRRVETTPFLTVFLPFGGAQFAQGRREMGTALGIAQGLAVTGSIITYANFKSKQGSDGRVIHGQKASAQGWRTANWVLFSLSVAVYAWSIADAVSHSQREEVTEAEVMLPNAPAPKEEAATPSHPAEAPSETDGSTRAPPPQPASASRPRLFFAPAEGGGMMGIWGTF